jgi:hypothetical protein
MEGVWLHDLGFLGIDVERAGGDVSITVRDTLVERSSIHAVDRCLVERSGDAGIAVGGATVDILRTVVRDTRGADGLFGDGVMTYGIVYLTGDEVTSEIPTLARIASSHIDGAARAGVSSFATTVSLEDTLVACSAFALNGEPFRSLTFSFTDEGNNRCGCDRVVDSCTVLSNGLTPPAPVEQ